MLKVLFAGAHRGFVGGVERYMTGTAKLLRDSGLAEVDCYAPEPAPGETEFSAAFGAVYDAPALESAPRDYDLVVIHKTGSAKESLRVSTHGRRWAVFVHDHEFYCPRKSYYRPFSWRNCRSDYSFLFCGICGSLRKPGSAADFCGAWEGFRRRWELLRRAPRFLVISEFMRTSLLRHNVAPGNIALIPPFIPVAELPAEPRGAWGPRLVVSGQLIRGKGMDQLVAALPMVRGNWTLDVLGSGQDLEKLRLSAAPFGDRVRFHGWCDPAPVLATADVAVLPWRWQEPFGLVGPEALAHGVPLVGFDVGAVREYLIGRQTGLLIPPGDISGLARAVNALTDNSAWARKLGAQGRDLVAEKYNLEKFLAGWRDFLTET